MDGYCSQSGSLQYPSWVHVSEVESLCQIMLQKLAQEVAPLGSWRCSQIIIMMEMRDKGT